MGSIVEKIKHL